MTVTLYAFALFAHVVGMVGLFVALGTEWLSLLRLRRAGTVEQVRAWAGATGSLHLAYAISTVAILASGAYMVVDVWGWRTPWVTVSLAAVVALAALGPLVNGRRVAAILRAAEAAPPGVVPRDLARRAADPVLWASVHAMIGVSLGVVFLMIVKPADAAWCVGILALAAVLGAGASVLWRAARGEATAGAPSSASPRRTSPPG